MIVLEPIEKLCDIKTSLRSSLESGVANLVFADRDGGISDGGALFMAKSQSYCSAWVETDENLVDRE